MEDKTTVHGLSANHPMWFVLACEAAVEMHWPKGIPPYFARGLPELRALAARFSELGSEMAAVLLVEGAEGVECPGWDRTNSEDDAPEPWKG